MKGTSCPLQVGTQLELVVEDLGHAGEGVARAAGWPVFVPGAVPGDKITAVVSQVHARYARAQLDRVITPSTSRVTPECPDFSACGGCQLQQWAYLAQLTWKQERVAQTLARVGGFSGVPIRPIIPAPSQWEYRNKAQFPVAVVDGAPRLGLYRAGSHELVPMQCGCRLVHPLIEKAGRLIEPLLPQLGPVYQEKNGRGLLRHVVIRAAFASEQVLVTLVCTRAEMDASRSLAAVLHRQLPELIGLTLNINPKPGNRILGGRNISVWGRPYVQETLQAPGGALNFHISAASFFQVNPRQAEQLFNTVCNYAQTDNPAVVLDAYCGTGSIALFLARSGVAQVWGIEEVPAAVADARHNAELNNIGNAVFYQGRVEEVAAELVDSAGEPDVIVVDPPRSGCDADFLRTAATWGARRWVYVSCNPATLARDLALLREYGYHPVELQPFDMFPQTSHVECVVLMQNVKNK